MFDWLSSSFSCSSILVNKPPSPRLAPAAINSLYESTLLGLLPDHFCTDSAEIGLNDARGAMRLSDLHMRDLILTQNFVADGNGR
ncbi:hypothetical protein Y032_0006g2986 [Ancylostoma ceylanicum]|uniref:Uncharacterized protein n=1 Tax=Ancylostoma ceylanicum TaxID=53326 RepID=A0A016VPG5_9BILA|nr:hypothetical protein Y032_0006g2986 [Ancylostoma ceylanicum]